MAQEIKDCTMKNSYLCEADRCPRHKTCKIRTKPWYENDPIYEAERRTGV